MRPLRLVVFVTLMSSAPIAAWADPYVNLIMVTMHQCYEQQNKIGTELAECMGNAFTKINNPENYRVNIYDDNPSKTIASKITILIYNQSGYQLNCIGTAQQKIVIDSCTDQIGKPLSAGELMSINPPPP